MALTQEASDDFDAIDFFDDFDSFFQEGERDDGFEIFEEEWGWMPPGPPRWFRSNAGGMTLEEIPSRLAALRNDYALVIDHLNPDEIDPFLLPFFSDGFSVEIRVLYRRGEFSRKQWRFNDDYGNIRLNAVFRKILPEEEQIDIDINIDAEAAEAIERDEESYYESAFEEIYTDTVIAVAEDVLPITAGFIEIFNQYGQITADFRFTDAGEEFKTLYFYNNNLLLRTETWKRFQNAESADYEKLFADTFRYNRSFSLRSVERVFYARPDIDPSFVQFPSRVLDIVTDIDFIRERVMPGTGFIETHALDGGYRMVNENDERGRILSRSMYDSEGELIWVVTNTWVEDRIVSVMLTAGDDVRITEYDFNSAGDRIAQRDINNGVLERQVFINGNKETEELFMDGVLVLRAFWEDGRKISEERIRRR